MRRMLYMACEFAVAWLFALAIGFGFLFAAGLHRFSLAGSNLGPLLFIGWALVSIPLAGGAVLFGSRRMSLAWGFYNPLRPVATLAQSGLLEREGAGRLSFDIGYRDSLRRDPFEIVRLLAVELSRLGVQHSHAGYLTATDGAARWRVEPALDGQRIAGWIEAENAGDRLQVLEGVRAFLVDTLSLTLTESGDEAIA